MNTNNNNNNNAAVQVNSPSSCCGLYSWRLATMPASKTYDLVAVTFTRNYPVTATTIEDAVRRYGDGDQSTVGKERDCDGHVYVYDDDEDTEVEHEVVQSVIQRAQQQSNDNDTSH